MRDNLWLWQSPADYFMPAAKSRISSETSGVGR